MKLLCIALLVSLAAAQAGEETLENRGITEEEIQVMTDSATPDSDAKTDEEKKLMEEWEQHMHDFVPQDITTIIVEPRSEVTFYVDAKEEPMYVRGAYFVGKSSTSTK